MTSLLPIPAMPLDARLVSPDVQPSLPLVDGLVHVALWVDDGAGPRLVTDEDLQAWNSTLDGLLPAALERLREASAAADWIGVETVPGMALYQALDGNSSARALILGHLVRDWPLAGVAVVTPSPDQLIAVPLHSVDDLDALNVMIASARVAWENSASPLTDQALWTDGTRWHHIRVAHDPDHIEVRLPPAAEHAIRQLAAMGLVATAGEA